MNQKILAVFTLAGAATLASTAQAHITLQTTAAPAASYYKAVFRVSHGCAGSPTTQVAVKIPAGFIAIKPQPKPGWQVATTTGAYANAYKLHGATVTEGVQTVTWSGGKLPDDEFDEFALMGYLTPELKADSDLYFPVVQTCQEGVTRWIEIPQAGESWGDLASPAPVLRLLNQPE